MAGFERGCKVKCPASESAPSVHTNNDVKVYSVLAWRRAAVPVAVMLGLCLASSRPLRAQMFSNSAGAATVVVATGQVSVIRNETVWALFPNHAVRVGETIVTEEDGYAELQVADGSRFYVFPDSRVVFRKNPGSLRDLVDVFLGRVRFEIQKLTGGEPRYRIFTPTAVISVRGTTFDVNVDPDETTVVAVDEGVVAVTHRLLPSNSELIIGAGESLVIHANTPLAKAGVNKAKAVQVASDMARTAAYIWSRIGRGGSSPGGGPIPGGTGAGTGGGLPGDESAPEPPPPPPPAP
jgi:ferric-dicitrate binding protein FerR (iron transport regulator)